MQPGGSAAAAPDATMIVTPVGPPDPRRGRVPAERSSESAGVRRAATRPDDHRHPARTVRPPATAIYQVDTVPVRLAAKRRVHKVKTFTEKPNLELARNRSSRAASFSGTRAYSSGKSMRSWKTSSELLPDTAPDCSHRSARELRHSGRNSKAIDRHLSRSAGTSRSTSA